MTPLFKKLNLGTHTVIHVLNAPADMSGCIYFHRSAKNGRCKHAFPTPCGHEKAPKSLIDLGA
jgi:hypothetical protein